MNDYLDMIGYYGSGAGGASTWLIVSVVIALAGTGAAVVFLIGANKRARLTGFMQKVFSHVNFENFIFAMIVKPLYVFIVLFLVFNGLFTMFTSSFITGLLMMVVGPFVVRILTESMMIFISILDQMKETNRLLRSGAQPRGSAPQQYGRPMHPQQPEGSGEEPQPEQPKHYPGGYDPMHRG